MIRRHSAIALAALGTLLLIAGDAAALTRQTRSCITAARLVRRSCSLQCATDLQSNIINCFGAQGSCPTNCFTQQSTCQLPIATARTECSGTCNAALRTTLQGCFDTADPAGCASAASDTASTCNAACREAASGPLSDCTDAFNACLETCP